MEELEIIKRGVEQVVTEGELIEKLKENRKLSIKFGADPTAPDIHLGHSVVLRKLRQFQDLGHIVYFIIGDFTARIGDPSGRNIARKSLTENEIKENSKTYEKQIFKILDKNKTKLVFNSTWCDKMSFSDFIKLAAKITVRRILERDDFEKRMKAQEPIGLHEILYPLIQAYDSVVLSADIEVCGTDQIFNCLVARDLQVQFAQKPEVIITLPLLIGTDGVQKMSKSYGNYIGITEESKEMFGKIMSIPDKLMEMYFKLLTDVSSKEIKEILNFHPKDAKKLLAKKIVSFYYSEDEAIRQDIEFERVFSKKELPSDIQEIKIKKYELKDDKIWIVKLLILSKIAKSNNEAQRLINQRAITIDGKLMDNPDFDIFLKDKIMIKSGKRKFINVTIDNK